MTTSATTTNSTLSESNNATSSMMSNDTNASNSYHNSHQHAPHSSGRHHHHHHHSNNHHHHHQQQHHQAPHHKEHMFMKKRVFLRTFDLSQIAEDPMDNYLDTLGLWKKRIARDGSCLFRAVAEQVRPEQHSSRIFKYCAALRLLLLFPRFIRVKCITRK